MNRTPDVELVLRDYFADDGLTAPDYVLDVVEERIGRQPQRRTWRLRWRPLMTLHSSSRPRRRGPPRRLRRLQLLPGRAASAVRRARRPHLQPSASPSAAPSAGAAVSRLEDRRVRRRCRDPAAGSHSSRGFVPAFTFSVPEGWVNSSDSSNYFELFPDTPTNQAEFARSGGFANSMVMGPNQSPYFVCDCSRTSAARRQPKSSPPWWRPKPLRRPGWPTWRSAA